MSEATESTEAIEVTIRLPGRDERGFLRRLREVRAIIDASQSPSDMWEKITGYVIAKGYIEAPAGVDPYEAIADLSQADMQGIVAALMGSAPEGAAKGHAKAVDPPNDA